jgi:type I restriction enzyme R subunit
MFTEQNTVEQMILDTLSGKYEGGRMKDEKRKDEVGRMKDEKKALFAEAAPAYNTNSSFIPHNSYFRYVPADGLQRSYSDVFIAEELRAALIRLNPCIAQEPERAEEVIYKLRAILLSVQADGLVRANEHFTQWLRNEKTMPFGPNNEHTVVRLLDFDNLANNDYIVTSQWVYRRKDEVGRMKDEKRKYEVGRMKDEKNYDSSFIIRHRAKRP